MERWVFQKMGKMGMMGKMGFKDGFFERWERWAFINPKIGKMGFYRCKDGKDGIKIPKRWERWVSNYKVLEKHQQTQKKIFIFRKTCTLEKNCFVKTHLSHHKNPSFPSFAKTHLSHLSRRKMGSGKMG